MAERPKQFFTKCGLSRENFRKKRNFQNWTSFSSISSIDLEAILYIHLIMILSKYTY